MDIGGRGMGVGDDANPAINRPVVEIEEALRLAVRHHVATLRIMRETCLFGNCSRALASGRLS